MNDLTPALLEALKGRLSDGCVREVGGDYLEEPRGLWRGRAGAVLAPRDTAEVAVIVGFAAEHGIGIVPRSGGTGLVGGQLSEEGAPIVLSFERMTAIRAVYPSENVIVAEAGAVLADVQAAAADVDRLFPLSYASEGSARIGGALAVNSGGVNVLRYGMARDLVLGVEAVMADGSVHHGLKRLRKDNTGYDLRNLLIGAEGTLGLITAASLRLFPVPKAEGTALFVLRDPEAGIELLSMAQASGGVSAFELMAGQGLRFLSEAEVPHRMPFEEVPAWSCLVELGLPEGGDPQSVLEDLFVQGAEAGLVSDGVVAQSETQRQELWTLRENMSEANKRIGAIASNDISLPISEVPGFLDACGDRLGREADLRINAFGHLGDGNLHYNLFPAEGRGKGDYDAEALRGIVTEEVMSRGGSFSAEHGVGRLKVGTLRRYGDPAKIAAMAAIKLALDPKGILNPGAVIDPEG